MSRFGHAGTYDRLQHLFSWQMDAPVVCNKGLIREALVATLKDESKIMDSPRFESGMEKTAGTPEVATVMFEKIRGCAIFVADTTLVGRITTKVDGVDRIKKTINPNVAVEMGFAAAHVGWDRIICVMNETPCYGRRDEQPFDVRNRRYPIDYTLNPEAAKDRAQRDTARDGLTQILFKAITAVEANELRKIEHVRRQLDVRCLKLMGLMHNYSSFPEPSPKDIARYPELGGMPADQFNSTSVRLLELGVLFANVDAAQVGYGYAYHWTYLGEQLLKNLRLR